MVYGLNLHFVIDRDSAFSMHLHVFTDPCNTMACGQLCINAKSGPRCLCAEGFKLSSDGRNCTGYNDCQNVYFSTTDDKCNYIFLFHLLSCLYYISILTSSHNATVQAVDCWNSSRDRP